MLGHIYNIFSDLECLVILLMVAHYVYLEPAFPKKSSRYLYLILFLLCITISEIFVRKEHEIIIFLPFLFLGIYIVIVRKKHRFRGFFMFIPIAGILYGLMMPYIMLPYIFTGVFDDEISLYDYLLDIIIIAGILLFGWKGKNWRLKFNAEIKHRHLEFWEKRLLNAMGLLLFIVAVLSMGITMEQAPSLSMRMIVGVGSIISMFLAIVIIAMISQGNKKNYYQNVAVMNEHYLKVELEHFKAYQIAQTETRRIRHDIKNHLYCLQHFAKEEKYDELIKYLEKIQGQVGEIDTGFHCGNEIADAICNEKSRIAGKNNITISVDGRISAEMSFQPIDICTIFANALDNAIEAVMELNADRRWIKITFSGQGNMQYIDFCNPVENDVNLPNTRETLKEDKMNHGFGLSNIRMAAEKYNGQTEISIKKQDDETIFHLEIILFDVIHNKSETIHNK